MKTKVRSVLLFTPVVALGDWEAIVLLPWWYAVWFAFPLAGAAAIVAGRLRRSPTATSAGVAMVVAGVVGGLLALGCERIQTRANQENGDRVVAALEQHWKESGAYPETLVQLVPRFLDRLPEPSLGVFSTVPWWYAPSERAGDFTFGYRPMPRCLVAYVKGKWECMLF